MANYFETLKLNKLATFNRISRIKKELESAITNVSTIIDTIKIPHDVNEAIFTLVTDFDYILTIIVLLDTFISHKLPNKNTFSKLKTKVIKLHKEAIVSLLNTKYELYYPGLYWLPHVIKQHIPTAPYSNIAGVTIKLVKMFHKNAPIKYDSLRYELRKRNYRITLHSIKDEGQFND